MATAALETGLPVVVSSVGLGCRCFWLRSRASRLYNGSLFPSFSCSEDSEGRICLKEARSFCAASMIAETVPFLPMSRRWKDWLHAGHLIKLPPLLLRLVLVLSFTLLIDVSWYAQYSWMHDLQKECVQGRDNSSWKGHRQIGPATSSRVKNWREKTSL